MASSSSRPSNGEHDYYYLLFNFTVAFIVLIISAMAIGYCTWSHRQFLSVCHLLNQHNDLEMWRWIPTFQYHKNEAGVGGVEEVGVAPECVICISPFDEGEEIRQLPLCRHLFHAGCIDLWLNRQNNCPICCSTVLLNSMNMST